MLIAARPVRDIKIEATVGRDLGIGNHAEHAFLGGRVQAAAKGIRQCEQDPIGASHEQLAAFLGDDRAAVGGECNVGGRCRAGDEGAIDSDFVVEPEGERSVSRRGREQTAQTIDHECAECAARPQGILVHRILLESLRLSHATRSYAECILHHRSRGLPSGVQVGVLFNYLAAPRRSPPTARNRALALRARRDWRPYRYYRSRAARDRR